MGLIYKSVLDKYLDFTQPLEGVIQWMYLDVKGLVTTGIGNLIDGGKEGADPKPGDDKGALALPWVNRKTKKKATKEEIAAEWQMIKGKTELAKTGASNPKSGAVAFATLELAMDDIEDLVAKKLESNGVELAKHFPGFKDFPADAQLGLLSMAWALGGAFAKGYPTFAKAVNKKTGKDADPDWAAAGKDCAMSEKGNPGVKPRNVADRLCFANALAVDADDDVDNSTLVWPKTATLNDQGKLLVDGKPFGKNRK
jgi:hypothetical protein